MKKTFKYIGSSKKAQMGDIVFEKGKPVEVDNGTLIQKLTEHKDFSVVEKKEVKEEARSPKNDAKQS